MPQIFECYTPEEAWEILATRRRLYYNKYLAAYSGSHKALASTAEKDSFWKRKGKAKVHVPIAADIAATSADMLFGEEPRYEIVGEERKQETTPRQERLTELLRLNNVNSRLSEGAESAAALGDVCLKLNWHEDIDYPTLTVVQADECLPEYMLGVLHCIHFFTILKVDSKTNAVWRVYERYEPGLIEMAVYIGSSSDLGSKQSDSVLQELGYSSEITPPIDEMLAIHIPNMKPNRIFRTSDMGRSDLEGLRDLMDSLDETYTSWMRDIRLSKSRLIVPATFLRRRNEDMFDEGQYTYEFDEDVETLVALDVDTDKNANITPSQFAIRTSEHEQTCISLIRNIVSMAGYAPQTFGIDVVGIAESGSALRIRERKSFNTRGKKENYWKAPLEKILSTMLHLDWALNSSDIYDGKEKVSVIFSDSVANDIATTANTVAVMKQAGVISMRESVAMLHPDWTPDRVIQEVNDIMNDTARMGQIGAGIQMQVNQAKEQAKAEAKAETGSGV